MATSPSVGHIAPHRKKIHDPETDLITGNNQGSVVIFEPSTSEHISARTIFDPITAIAPATDCKTYAIGSVSPPHTLPRKSR